jgi:Ca2+-binding RTX toxin-like protein
MPQPPNKGPKNNVASIDGTDLDDIITLNSSPVATTNGDDTVFGMGGNDWIEGAAGNDTLDGGAGYDTVFGGDGDDTINGGQGFDFLFGEAGNDTIDGGIDADWIEGGLGDDVIFGGDGDDFLFGEEGLDTINGGDGSDLIDGGGGNDTIDGGAGADVIDGGLGNDTINGGDDNDIIIGGTGDDTLFGDLGDDEFIGGMGNDSIDGGDGSDTVTYYGVLGDDFSDPSTDYTIEMVQETVGKGKNKTTVDVIYVTAADGTVDRIVNVDFENVEFLDPVILTGIDLAVLDLNTEFTKSINVLANDFLAKSYEEPAYGSELMAADITDIFIDTNEDGVNDIVFDADAIYSAPVELTDGSSVQLEADGTLTFTLSGTVEYGTEDIVKIEYEVSANGVDPATGIAIIDLTSSGANPAPGESLTLDTLVGYEFEILPGYSVPVEGIYVEGSYAVSQLTNPYGGSELDGALEARLSIVDGTYNFNGEGTYNFDVSDVDDEFLVWTEEGTGTTHEMNVTSLVNVDIMLGGGGDYETIDLESVKISDLGVGEGVTLQYYSSDGQTILDEEYIVSGDLVDGTFYATYEGDASGYGQISFVADVGTDVFVDDIVLV